ncbi:MAG: endolytic transglycosylase MltG [Bacteroides sp.]|nr:endolytic transglycosylase MltG [Bacteroides sp.]
MTSIPQPDNQNSTDNPVPVSQSDSESQSDSISQSSTESESQSDGLSQSSTESQSKSDGLSQSSTESQSKSDSLSQSSTESQSKSDGQSQSFTESSPKQKTGRKRFIAIGVVAAMVVVGFLIFTLPLVMVKAPEKAVIRIPINASSENVRDSISKYLGDSFAAKVMRVAWLRGSDFSNRHGAYLIEEGLSPLRAERRLSQGAQHPLTITINGFRTLPTLTERVSRRLDFSTDSLAAALADKNILSQYGLSKQQAIALFIDDSYELYWSASPQQLIEKIGANYNRVWNKQRRDKAAALGLSPAEVMTLASIVDEESNKLDEKGKIGRLYINRIKTGMPLQADPTVRFALNDFTIRRVRAAHLKVNSPYNTYLKPGLPPGPIRTTSVATIDAILNSEPSNHLYMCAKEDFSGYHNFASTYPEHLANARRYQKALDARGIK